jgi:predicted lipoprotein with Yx(FWY)xxD motif
MTRILIAFAAAATGALALAASEPPMSPAEVPVAKQVTKLKLKRSEYGRVLFADGYALYLFTRDDDSGSRCAGECAEVWPPLTATQKVVTGEGVKRRLLGTTTRPDGSKQLTYAGHPLYGYVDDPRGEVFCNDVFEFGGTWYAVNRSGRRAEGG